MEPKGIAITIDSTNAESYIEETKPRHMKYKITHGTAIIRYTNYITNDLPNGLGNGGRGIKIHYYPSTGEEAVLTMRISDLEAAIECIKKDMNYR